MTGPRPANVKKLLAKPDMHEAWESSYRADENERFYDELFGELFEAVAAPAGSTILDAGCGPGAHSRRLAGMGFRVHAVDFSEAALRMARESLGDEVLAGTVELHREDLVNLSLADESFDYVLCWGVLMHVPDFAGAVAELARVLKPGGTLIVSEANVHSVEAIVLKALRRVLKRGVVRATPTPFGVELWKGSGEDALLIRHTNIGALVRCFEQHGVHVRSRTAGQFSEAYTLVPGAVLKRAVHRINRFWLRRVRDPRPAFGNVLVLRKAE